MDLLGYQEIKCITCGNMSNSMILSMQRIALTTNAFFDSMVAV
jgi:hypothetical protein